MARPESGLISASTLGCHTWRRHTSSVVGLSLTNHTQCLVWPSARLFINVSLSHTHLVLPNPSPPPPPPPTHPLPPISYRSIQYMGASLWHACAVYYLLLHKMIKYCLSEKNGAEIIATHIPWVLFRPPLWNSSVLRNDPLWDGLGFIGEKRTKTPTRREWNKEKGPANDQISPYSCVYYTCLRFIVVAGERLWNVHSN